MLVSVSLFTPLLIAYRCQEQLTKGPLLLESHVDLSGPDLFALNKADPTVTTQLLKVYQHAVSIPVLLYTSHTWL